MTQCEIEAAIANSEACAWRPGAKQQGTKPQPSSRASWPLRNDERIEAVYVFPLPHEAAVDDMTMAIGSRKIVGVIKRRAEALGAKPVTDDRLQKVYGIAP